MTESFKSDQSSTPGYGDGRLWLPPSPHSFGNKLARALWAVVWLLLFRPSPWFLRGWRCFLLRLFGAQIGPGAFVHSSVKVWAPWNLRMGRSATLSWGVDCYSVAPVILEDYAIVSQYTYLCTASHDYEHAQRPVISAPITIGSRAWLCACVFVGPGVKIGEGTVVGARSSVFRDLPSWCVAVGNPAKSIRQRNRSGATAQ